MRVLCRDIEDNNIHVLDTTEIYAVDSHTNPGRNVNMDIVTIDGDYVIKNMPRTDYEYYMRKLVTDGFVELGDQYRLEYDDED